MRYYLYRQLAYGCGIRESELTRFGKVGIEDIKKRRKRERDGSVMRPDGPSCRLGAMLQAMEGDGRAS